MGDNFRKLVESVTLGPSANVLISYRRCPRISLALNREQVRLAVTLTLQPNLLQLCAWFQLA